MPYDERNGGIGQGDPGVAREIHSKRCFSANSKTGSLGKPTGNRVGPKFK